MSILCSPQGDVGLLLHGCIIIINVIHDGGLLFANLSTNELHSPLCSVTAPLCTPLKEDPRQSHYIEVAQGAIFMEQNMRFGLILGRLAILKRKNLGRL